MSNGAVERLRHKVALSLVAKKVYIPPYVKTDAKTGKAIKVDGHFKTVHTKGVGSVQMPQVITDADISGGAPPHSVAFKVPDTVPEANEIVGYANEAIKTQLQTSLTGYPKGVSSNFDVLQDVADEGFLVEMEGRIGQLLHINNEFEVHKDIEKYDKLELGKWRRRYETVVRVGRFAQRMADWKFEGVTEAEIDSELADLEGRLSESKAGMVFTSKWPVDTKLMPHLLDALRFRAQSVKTEMKKEQLPFDLETASKTEMMKWIKSKGGMYVGGMTLEQQRAWIDAYLTDPADTAQAAAFAAKYPGLGSGGVPTHQLIEDTVKQKLQIGKVKALANQKLQQDEIEAVNTPEPPKVEVDKAKKLMAERWGLRQRLLGGDLSDEYTWEAAGGYTSTLSLIHADPFDSGTLELWWHATGEHGDSVYHPFEVGLTYIVNSMNDPELDEGEGWKPTGNPAQTPLHKVKPPPVGAPVKVQNDWIKKRGGNYLGLMDQDARDHWMQLHAMGNEVGKYWFEHKLVESSKYNQHKNETTHPGSPFGHQGKKTLQRFVDYAALRPWGQSYFNIEDFDAWPDEHKRQFVRDLNVIPPSLDVTGGDGYRDELIEQINSPGAREWTDVFWASFPKEHVPEPSEGLGPAKAGYPEVFKVAGTTMHLKSGQEAWQSEIGTTWVFENGALKAGWTSTGVPWSDATLKDAHEIGSGSPLEWVVAHPEAWTKIAEFGGTEKIAPPEVTKPEGVSDLAWELLEATEVLGPDGNQLQTLAPKINALTDADVTKRIEQFPHVADGTDAGILQAPSHIQKLYLYGAIAPEHPLLEDVPLAAPQGLYTAVMAKVDAGVYGDLPGEEQGAHGMVNFTLKDGTEIIVPLAPGDVVKKASSGVASGVPLWYVKKANGDVIKYGGVNSVQGAVITASTDSFDALPDYVPTGGFATPPKEIPLATLTAKGHLEHYVQFLEKWEGLPDDKVISTSLHPVPAKYGDDELTVYIKNQKAVPDALVDDVPLGVKKVLAYSLMADDGAHGDPDIVKLVVDKWKLGAYGFKTGAGVTTPGVSQGEPLPESWAGYTSWALKLKHHGVQTVVDLKYGWTQEEIEGYATEFNLTVPDWGKANYNDHFQAIHDHIVMSAKKAYVHHVKHGQVAQSEVTYDWHLAAAQQFATDHGLIVPLASTSVWEHAFGAIAAKAEKLHTLDDDTLLGDDDDDLDELLGMDPGDVSPPSPPSYTKYLLSGETSPGAIASQWSYVAVEEYASQYNLPIDAHVISEHIAGLSAPASDTGVESSAPISPLDYGLSATTAATHKFEVEGLVKTSLDIGKGMHTKYDWKDKDGVPWLSKPFPNDPNSKARVDAENVANRIGRLFGFGSPASTVQEIGGEYSYVQHVKDAIGNMKPVTPTDLTDEQLTDVAVEHVLDWLVANHDSHSANLLRGPDGRVFGIDKGQAYKFFPNDKLAVGYLPPGNGEEVWYDKVYRAVIKGELSEDQANKMASAVIQRAKYIETAHDGTYEQLLEEAFQHRTKFPKGHTKATFIQGLKTRKKNLSTDFEDFWKDIFQQAGYTWNPQAAAPPRVENDKGSVYSGFSPEYSAEVSGAGSVGVPSFWAGTDLEDSHVIVSVNQGPTGAPVLRGEAKLRQDADTRVTKWFSQQTVTAQSGQKGASAGPVMTVLPGRDDGAEKIKQAAITVNHHVNAGDFTPNPNTMAALETYREQLAETYVKIEALPQGQLYPGPVFGQEFHTLEQQEAWKDMATTYLEQIKQVQDAAANNTKTPSKKYDIYGYAPKAAPTVAQTWSSDSGVLEKLSDGSYRLTQGKGDSKTIRFIDEPAAKKMLEDKNFDATATVDAGASKPLKVFKRKSAFDTGSYDPVSGTLQLDGGSTSALSPGERYDIEIGDEILIEYRPWNGLNVVRSQQGTLRFTIKEWKGDPNQLEDIRIAIEAMGVPMKPADERDLELFYWRHLYGILSDRKRTTKGQESGYAEMKQWYATHPNPDPDDELAMLKAAFSKVFTKKQVADADFMPKHLRASNTDAPVGKPFWVRPDSFTLEEIRDFYGDNMITHGVTIRKPFAPGITNEKDEFRHRLRSILGGVGVMSTEERMRVIGRDIHGASSGSDQSHASSAFTFNRPNSTSRNFGSFATFILNPLIANNTSNYSFSGDKYGEANAKKGVPFNLKPMMMMTQEIMIKNGWSWLETLEMLVFDAADDREYAIKFVKEELGITHVRGLPIEERFVTKSSSHKTYAKKAWAHLLDNVSDATSVQEVFERLGGVEHAQKVTA